MAWFLVEHRDVTLFPQRTNELAICCTENLPKDYHLVETHAVGGGGLASSDDSYSYAGGSVSSWQGHSSQTGQRVGAILNVVHWPSRLGVGHGDNNSTP
jgi:hypothetical protein